MKHTRGPWQIRPEEIDKSYIRIRGAVCGTKYKIANVLCIDQYDADEARANARLIRMAPEMLDFLIAIRNQGDYYDGLDELIKKATGE